MVVKSSLGKGLGALIPQGQAAAAAEAAGRGILEIELTRITPNIHQPRKTFREEGLADLAASIKSNGVIQPVVVRKKDGGGYELIAGERRFRASMVAGLKKIPAIIKDVAPEGVLELALIENIQREDLNPVETAEAYERLIKESEYTQEQLAERVGKERSTVANFLRLLALPSEIKRDLAEGALTMGHAKALLSLDAAHKQVAIRREILARGLSVRETEALVRKMKSPVKVVRKKPASAQLAMLEDELKRKLGTKVHIKNRGKGGKIEIEYYSADEFERILDLIRG
ncbi:MAG TPA: ParB/RepB/Spo0J family partition protein [Nitrospirota bacterium]